MSNSEITYFKTELSLLPIFFEQTLANQQTVKRTVLTNNVSYPLGVEAIRYRLTPICKPDDCRQRPS